MSSTTLTKSHRPSTAPGTANIWQLMNYHIPRGKCNYKTSLIAPCCPCLRFMLNPLQAASSFACDGCGHHASFHSLRDKEEDAIAQVTGTGTGKKRRSNGRDVVDLSDSGDEAAEEERRRGDETPRTNGKANGKANGTGGGKRVRRDD